MILMKTQPSKVSKELIAELKISDIPPYISLYQSTHRRHPENQQDPIRFRNLLNQVESSLRLQYPLSDVRQLLLPFEELLNEDDFWKHSLDGLAIMRNPRLFHVIRLPLPVTDLVITGKSFNIKPLRYFLQSANCYHVLSLSRDKIRLFEGSRETLTEIDLLLDDSEINIPTQERPIGNQHNGVLPFPVRKNETGVSLDIHKFFRNVDREIRDYYSRPTGLPLILATLPEHHRIFRDISQNPLLVTEGIMMNPESIPLDEFHEMSLKIIDKEYLDRITILATNFLESIPLELASDDLDSIAKAAFHGRIATLLIDSKLQIPGYLDPQTGKVCMSELCDPHIHDLLDDLGEFVIKMGGKVFLLPSNLMPTRNGHAATFRY